MRSVAALCRSCARGPIVGTALVLLLGACGSVEEGGAAAEEAVAGAPITLTDARGEQISLDGPASEVVGLEWGVVENLVSLGVMPTGAADVEGYGQWVTAAPLDADVQDVGTRGEPSIDALVALDPDLVIATTDLPANVVEQIEQALPVLVVRAASAERPIEQMKDTLTLVAEAVGRTSEATALLEDFDAAVAEGAKEIESAGLAGRELVLADGYQQGSTVSIRMFTETSLAGAVGEALGLQEAWVGEGDPDYGLAQTDVEGLTALGDVEMLYYANDSAGGDPFADGLSGNAIWSGLPFVTSGNVHRLPDGIWMFGGPASTEQLVEATVAAVTS